jgi:hypothetical protein
MKEMIEIMTTCGELMDCMIVLEMNLSTGLVDGLSLSKRLTMMLSKVKLNMSKVVLSKL